VLQKAQRAEIGAEPECLQVVTLPQTRKPGEQSNPPGFSSGHYSARSLLDPTLRWERAEQKRRYNNLCPLTVPFLPSSLSHSQRGKARRCALSVAPVRASVGS